VQKALKIIEQIKEIFEKDAEFEKKPQIRIALHVATEQSLSERHTTYQLENQQFTVFKDIAGEDVINTARIEPVVKPNCVFCSNAFAVELKTLQSTGFNPDIETATLDTHKLGKEHDSFEVELFAVFHKNNQPNTTELKQHIHQKLDKREETYQQVSPLTGGYTNQGVQVLGDVGKTIVKNVKAAIEHIGDKIMNVHNNQSANKIYNIDNRHFPACFSKEAFIKN